MKRFSSADDRIAYLEARVEALEAALARRSRQLRLIQQHLDDESLLLVSRITSGLPPLPRRAHDLELWQESWEMHPADVEDTMTDLWRSLTPLEEPDEPR